MNIPTDRINDVFSPQPRAIAELTLALEKTIQELAISAPQTISIFFDGAEVYRQQTQDDRVFWWNTDDNSTPFTADQITLFTSPKES